ncbi:YDG/SRA domain-containing protein [Streptomyces sp. NPDC001876]|uniref:YDG/SRA domain-containing protein n=1 Tax=Streptomyces sp. NPDC001876 TaxID=3154402 RepID=UPI00332183D0
MIGELPGIAVGQAFPNRRALHDAGVHRPLQAGICGTRQTGAESIVVSGGYADDEDYGVVIIYTGHGGRDPETQKQVAEQSLTDSGNAALVTSYLEGFPVRVVRGAQARSPHAPAEGYRYDGLFGIASFGSKMGVDGFRVWQFRLEAMSQPEKLSELDSQGDSPVAMEGASPRKFVATQRIVRNTGVARQVKAWHVDHCQVCGTRLVVPGGTYSEAAHIQALGAPHNGPDVVGNVLCLCPNCHVLFDAGALYLRDDLVVMAGESEVGPLRLDSRHQIRLEFVRSHRSRWRQ